MTQKIVDTHQHLWDLDLLHLPWVSDIPKLNHSFSNKDYFGFTSQSAESSFSYDIDRTLYMEVDVAEQDIQAEIDFVLDLCRDEECPQVGMIASARPESDTFEASIDFALSNPEIKGFRRVLHTGATPAGTCLDNQFLSSLRLLANHALTFDICIRREELHDVTTLASCCPENQFILDHCGNADVRMSPEDFALWEHAIRAIAKQDNVVCKVSGFGWTIQHRDWSYDQDVEPILRVVFESFGEDRVLFGGDWPVCTLSELSFQQWLNAIHRFASDFGSQTASKLFDSNASRTYRI